MQSINLQYKYVFVQQWAIKEHESIVKYRQVSQFLDNRQVKNVNTKLFHTNKIYQGIVSINSRVYVQFAYKYLCACTSVQVRAEHALISSRGKRRVMSKKILLIYFLVFSFIITKLPSTLLQFAVTLFSASGVLDLEKKADDPVNIITIKESWYEKIWE